MSSVAFSAQPLRRKTEIPTWPDKWIDPRTNLDGFRVYQELRRCVSLIARKDQGTGYNRNA
jgi:hypothetical protein